MFKSVLLALKPSKAQAYVIDYAVALAARLGAELKSITIIDLDRLSPAEPVPLGAAAFKQERDAARLEAAYRDGEGATLACRAAADAAGVPCQVAVVHGDVVDLLAREVREHDLFIVGHSAEEAMGDKSLQMTILKSVPRPTILFPKRKIEGSDVVLAYDGSLQSTRVLASFAASGLGLGRTVHVLSAQATKAQAEQECGVACRFLQRHGIIVKPHPQVLHGSPADAMKSLSGQLGAGLLVMGAFGQPSLREFFLGSTTRSLLSELPLPIFLDH